MVMDAFDITDSPPKPRPWFQFHLSTCVVLMVVAGVLVWANTRSIVAVEPKRSMFETGAAFSSALVEYAFGSGEVRRGWPFEYYFEVQEFTASMRPSISGHVYPAQDVRQPRMTDWRPSSLCINITVAFAILALTAVACEYHIRRRRARLEDNATRRP